MGGSGQPLRAPFPWFGGKSQVAPVVWKAFGDVRNYVEPFFGSGAVLLGRPTPFEGIETVNDLDGYVSNFWRATQADPEAVAHYADWPVNENDLHARHAWLVGQRAEFVTKIEGNPDFFDAKVAGWWVWGLCCWIGGGWCSGMGPWTVSDGKLLRQGGGEGQGVRRRVVELVGGKGINRKLTHLGGAGQGVNRQGVYLRGDGQGVHRKLAHLGDAGRGVNRNIAHLGNSGVGVNKQSGLVPLFDELAERLRRVRVCCGDWGRVCTPTPTTHQGLTGVLLDPPYAGSDHDEVYACDDAAVGHAVAAWAIEHGDDPMMRIVLCGYEGSIAMPETWRKYEWKARGGYENQGGDGAVNCHRERLWLSPHCCPLVDAQAGLFERAEAMREEAATYQGDDVHGALMGELDAMVEQEMIREETSAQVAFKVQQTLAWQAVDGGKNT